MLISMLFLMAAQAGAPATAAASPAVKPDKIVCKSELVAYSRIPERVCRKQSEWDSIAKQNEEDIRRSANQRQNPGNEPGR